MWGLAIAPLAVVALSGNVAYAQAPPFDPAFDIQLFDLSVGPSSFISVVDTTTVAKKQYSLDFLLTFLTNPFLINNFDENTGEVDGPRTEVVSSLFAGQLVGAYGLAENLQLGVSLPLVFSISGDGLNPATAGMTSGGIQATGFGDLRLEAKGAIIPGQDFGAAWYGGFTLPTSFGAGGNDYLGDDLPSFRAGAAAHWQSGSLRVGGNLGIILRKPRQIYAFEIGQQLTYGVGSSFALTKSFSLIGEVFGRSGLTELNLSASPLEAGGGLRIQATDSFAVTAGGGAGVIGGIGSPGLRFVVSVGYAPDLGDDDGDGVSNMKDRCPLLAEDRDGFEDSDGCPDDDNDGDRREDDVDKCPLEKEDIDGFEDEDGCPEYDNDGDKILDPDDKCPVDAEDHKQPYPNDGCPGNMRDSDDDGVSDALDQCPDDYEDEDGFEDWDGCPEEDNDKDGVSDENDACPLCPEDKDGFQDGDGCPEFDNDSDGIPDTADKCPAEAEVFNGNSDEDGCPDSGTAIASMQGARLQINSEVKFSSSNRLRDRRPFSAVSKIMIGQSNVTKWRIVVSDGRSNRAKSQAQADAIKAVLVANGVKTDRLEAFGAASSTKTVVIAVFERADPDPSSFVCPASVEVQERPNPADTTDE